METEEFYNQCHGAGGKFCATGGGSGSSSEKWFDTGYLKTGSPRQRSAHAALEATGIMQHFKKHNPVLVSTVPLGIDTATSDLDILFHAKDLKKFDSEVKARYGEKKMFKNWHREIDGLDTSITNFDSNGWTFELVAQNRPVRKQTAFLHTVIEDRLLKLGGPKTVRQVRSLKRSGTKTEPAFAKVFKIDGDNPYKSLLDLEKLSDTELKKRIEIP